MTLANYNCKHGYHHSQGCTQCSDDLLLSLRKLKPITDADRIDWLEKIMTGGPDYCEVYLAGLRDGHADATAYQVESQPELFATVNAPTLREAIDKAMLSR